MLSVSETRTDDPQTYTVYIAFIEDPLAPIAIYRNCGYDFNGRSISPEL